MPPPQGSASPAPDGLGPAGSDIASVRNATNWRAVQRLLPDLADILDTSTYSVIYHYNEEAGKWEKQKQEGPLFVVRRSSKTPEYALFMLNRQTVKNVTIPLYPGEMKATVIDPSMLQVARRGEKIRYGIWFTEGEETVQRFRDSIFKIVGEPSKNTGARASPAPAVQTQAAPAAPAAADGLSRLFAGLTTIPANSLSQSQPQSQSQSQSQSPQPPLPSQPQPQPPAPQPQPQFTSPPTQQMPPHQQMQQHQYAPPPFAGAPGYAPPTHPNFQPYPAAYAQYTPAPAPGSPAAQPQQQTQQPHVIRGPVAPYRPGETVDDLLKGMLGGISGPVGPMPPAHQSPISSNRNSPPGPVPSQSNRRSGASRGTTSPRRQNGTPKSASPAPAAPAMRDALVNTFAPEGSHPPPVVRAELIGSLVHLLQTNEQFGEDVWRAYSSRSGQ